ncbi:hypothetical protein ALC57_15573 [Trachymyrmex cornetzi]|uniref:Uncharacterized protein n=1 Tax=Trachymyrmex cornetzi TaxID=471704 RepID=A0A151IWQ4_9HYME|nr:hypothetical protein ALC57_15573 [Trachymyrmex cornetzi]
MPNPRRRGRQRESVGGPGGYFTDTQKTVVTICIGTLILAPGVSSCSSGPDCSVPFDRLTSATNAPFSMLVFEPTRTNRVLLRAASFYELFVKLIIVIVVVIVVVVVKYNPPVLIDVAPIVVEHLLDAPLVDYRGAPALQIPLVTVVRRRAAFALDVRANTQYRGFLVTVGVRGLFILLVSLAFRVIVIVVISIVLLILFFFIFHVAVFISRLIFFLVFLLGATFGITFRFAVGHRSATNGTRTFGNAVRLFGPRAISMLDLVDHLNDLIRRIRHRLLGDRCINIFYDDLEETRNVLKVTLFRCHFFCGVSSRVRIIFNRESRFVPTATLSVPGTILH